MTTFRLAGLHKEVTLLRYHNEYHALKEFADEEDLTNRIIQWFQAHLSQ